MSSTCLYEFGLIRRYMSYFCSMQTRQHFNDVNAKRMDLNISYDGRARVQARHTDL